MVPLRLTPPLLAEAGTARRRRSSDPDHEDAPDFHAQNSVTEVITTRVRPGWKVPSSTGRPASRRPRPDSRASVACNLQPPSSDRQATGSACYDSPSPAAARCLAGIGRASEPGAESEPLSRAGKTIASHGVRRLVPYRAARGKPPATWKQTMLVLLVLFPIVMLELRFLSPWLASLIRRSQPSSATRSASLW